MLYVLLTTYSSTSVAKSSSSSSSNKCLNAGPYLFAPFLKSVLYCYLLQDPTGSSSVQFSCVFPTAGNECGNYGEIIYSANIYLPCGYQSPPESYANLSTRMDLTGVHIFSLSEVCFDFPLGDCNSAFGRTNAGQLTYWIGLINCTSGFFL